MKSISLERTQSHFSGFCYVRNQACDRVFFNEPYTKLISIFISGSPFLSYPSLPCQIVHCLLLPFNILLYPVPTIITYPILFFLIYYHPILHFSILLFLSYPILSYHIYSISFNILPCHTILHPSYPILSFSILFYPFLSYPILSYPILCYPILSYPILSYPFLPYLFLSYLLISCSIFPYFIPAKKMAPSINKLDKCKQIHRKIWKDKYFL